MKPEITRTTAIVYNTTNKTRTIKRGTGWFISKLKQLAKSNSQNLMQNIQTHTQTELFYKII